MNFNKELSWLSFNERVLQEAADQSVPLIERIRFLGIYSSNLDEFFRVRVGNIRRCAMVEAEQDDLKDKWEVLHQDISLKVNQLTNNFKIIADNTFGQLAKENIITIFDDSNNSQFKQHLSVTQLDWLSQYFANKIKRHITPIIIHSKTQLVNCIDDDGIYFLVALHQAKQIKYALVEIPREETERFIVLPSINRRKTQYIVMLDDVVQYFLNTLFEGVIEFDSIDAYSMKLTRDAEYNLTDDLDESLLDQMSKGLKQRLKADMVRLVYDRFMPQYMLNYLAKALKVKHDDDLAPGVRYRHFKDFVKFPNLGAPQLENPELPALDCTRFTVSPSIFTAISQQDILLYYPYHKFSHFTEFVRQASYDPLVHQIKINIYRVAKHSRIIQSLIEAVKNGKKVSVVVELKARFDEQANIEWAKVMKDAGIEVEFGIETLKIHSKLCLVFRKEHDKIVRYAHIGTGNFHEKNARIYTDLALFTKHKEICQEVDNVFSFISHSYKRFRFNHLIVSPLTSRRRLYQLIDNEIDNAQQNRPAAITLKLNNLVDTGLISKLYNASQAGVNIKILVRGMCSLIPGIKGKSDNISIISIIDRFLEHPRVMLFHHHGEQLLFISSGDWMERNIDHRVEVACPIYDTTLKQRIIDILDLHFQDNVKARIIDSKQSNQYVPADATAPVRSQIAIYHYLKAQEIQEMNIQPTTSKHHDE
ncbi:polyphosphate kinase 1 [Thalassotalea sp. G2M2-11]|uniref:polyphosphate kinase 1 n=1 Tax=Thalassotalea sp. G2M2-11 TaxID=2787627 RepID=UPI0019D0C4A2|nr:polyphosphate kinase 1 [Thalassotalea sp. G2M2-11]